MYLKLFYSDLGNNYLYILCLWNCIIKTYYLKKLLLLTLKRKLYFGTKNGLNFDHPKNCLIKLKLNLYTCFINIFENQSPKLLNFRFFDHLVRYLNVNCKILTFLKKYWLICPKLNLHSRTFLIVSLKIKFQIY